MGVRLTAFQALKLTYVTGLVLVSTVVKRRDSIALRRRVSNLCHVCNTLCPAMQRHTVTLCRAMWWYPYVMLYYSTLFDATLRDAMLCYATLCYVWY